jgi:hypothetical protein
MREEKFEQNSPSSSKTVELLATLAKSSDKWVQLGTLILIGLAGLGNWLATWNSSDRNKAEIETSRRVLWESNERVRQEVIKQIDEMHGWIKDAMVEFHRGNQDSAENRKILTKIVQDDHQAFEAHQTEILKNQGQILKEIHAALKAKQ